MGRSFCDHEEASGTKSLHPVTKQAAAGPSCQGESSSMNFSFHIIKKHQQKILVVPLSRNNSVSHNW